MKRKILIKFDNFSFSYLEGEKILQKIDLEIYEGERILILGPSGCGKSTLSLCLNGIIPHLIDGRISGSLKVEGMETSGTPVPILSQKTGIVFQDPESQFCMLRVSDEIAFGLENLKKERALMIEDIDSALTRVDMQSYSNILLNQLSGGMKQRIALAAVLAIDQPIMVFDEPTSNLDPQGTREVAKIIRNMPPDKTLLIIEHKLDYFIDIFDRIVILDRNGRVAAVDTAAKILTGYEETLKELGVWLPQIPKYMNKITKSTEYRIFSGPEHLPLNIGDAKKAVSSSPFADDIISIIGREIDDEILPLFYKADTSGKDNTKPVMAVRNLRFKYSGSENMVIKDINLTINQGDFMAIAGQNGSGKTTLAKIFIGLLKPLAGSKIAVRNPAADPGYESENRSFVRTAMEDILSFTGFVFQNPEHQFIQDTVYDEILLSLRSRATKSGCGQADTPSIKGKADNILRLMGLEGLKERNPFSLSQGQKRRLSVASILVMDHQILILDEPTFGQDYKNTTRLMDILMEYHRRGKTVIIITHDMNLIFRYCNKVAVLKEGALAYSGSSRKLLYNEDVLSRCGLDVPPLFRLYQEVKTSAVL